MYDVRSTKGYRKALKRISRHKDFNEDVLKDVVRTLARGESLEPKYRDHQLTGKFNDRRECHIQHNLLLMCELHESILVLVLVGLGTHDDLFG